MVSWLTGLEYTNSIHTSVIHEIMDCLMQCHRDFCVEKLMRNFANTIDHRQKHRIVALLLSLDPFVNEVSFILLVFNMYIFLNTGILFPLY